jgi:restriction system protein
LLIRLPWWLHACVAVALWMGIRHWVPQIAPGTALGDAAARSAPAIAWLAAACMSLVAALSLVRAAWRRWRLKRRASPRVIGKLSWSEFESLAGELYQRKGYRVEQRPRAGADGGIDLVLHRDGEKTLVQCKHWKSRPVGVSIVRELRGLVASEEADRGIVVCSGRFTAAAEAYAGAEPVDLVDGPRLAELIRASC